MGSRVGVEKTAAKRAGVSPEEWDRERKAGNKWCYCCRSWKAQGDFGTDRTRTDGLTPACKQCVSYKATASRYRLTVATARELRTGTLTCDICGRRKPLEVDHNHETGAVRGMLCGRCNKAIGLFKDSLLLLAKATAYLEKHDGEGHEDRVV